MDNKDDHMKDMLDGLTDMINKAYLPLMQDKPDTRMQMEKFVKQVQTSMQQAYGNITIRVPDLDEKASTEELCGNKQLVDDLIVTVVSILTLYFLFWWVPPMSIFGLFYHIPSKIQNIYS